MYIYIYVKISLYSEVQTRHLQKIGFPENVKCTIIYKTGTCQSIQRKITLIKISMSSNLRSGEKKQSE